MLGKLDWEDDVVDGVRDLIDFFPLHLDIKSLLQIFDPTAYRYVLKSAEANLKLVLTDLQPVDVRKYLIDVPTARELGDDRTHAITGHGLSLNPSMANSSMDPFGDNQRFRDFLQAIKEQDRGTILLEGVKIGNKPLVLEVVDPAGNQVFATSLNLSLDGVEQMFRQKNLIKELSVLEEVGGGYEDFFVPAVPFVGPDDRLQPEDFANPAHFTGFAADNDRNDFIHVHGYNVNDQAARGEQAETFKRLYWSGSTARFWGITWFGWDSQITIPIPGIDTRSPNYHINVRHAFDTSRLLKDFVAASHLDQATIFAHSLGNMVVSSAIDEGMTIGRYLMVNAAVAEEAYTPQASYDGGTAYEDGSPWRGATKESMYHPAWRYPNGVEIPMEQGYQPFLWASEWYKLFSPGDGQATLTWRNLFDKVRGQNTYVYYAPTDEAFRPFNYTVKNAADNDRYQPNVADWPGWEDVAQNWAPTNRSKLGTYSWAVQELFKGRFATIADKDSDTGGWGFNFDPQDEYAYLLINVLPALANVSRPEQMKTKPLFSKNPDYAFLYTDQPAPVSAPMREELLANEFPALTFAAGHRGALELNGPDGTRNIDIREKFAVRKPWPQDRLDGYEWRHSDIYVVAYQYLSMLYDEWVKLIEGE